MKVGPLKFVITTAAILLNCLMTSVAFSVLADTHRIVSKVGNREVAIITDNGNRFIQDRDSALSVFGYAMLAGFLVMSMPLLGAYISYAKRRGLAEGYNLVTFFSCIGLVVALSLPTNQVNA